MYVCLLTEITRTSQLLKDKQDRSDNQKAILGLTTLLSELTLLDSEARTLKRKLDALISTNDFGTAQSLVPSLKTFFRDTARHHREACSHTYFCCHDQPRGASAEALCHPHTMSSHEGVTTQYRSSFGGPYCK